MENHKLNNSDIYFIYSYSILIVKTVKDRFNDVTSF